MYYGSYSLPTYVTLWNADAFFMTTVVPLAIMVVIVFVVLSWKMTLSPLRFLRRELKRKQKKKTFKLNTKISIIKRFRLRVIFQNFPNYLTIFIGVFFANFILMFGLFLEPLLDHFQETITDNMLCKYQYVLKSEQETSTATAEKYSAKSLKTNDEKLKAEDATVYGISDNSRYVDLDFEGNKVYVSNAYAQKFDIEEGDTITVDEAYGSESYELTVGGTYYYPASIAVFISKNAFDEIFDKTALNGCAT